MRLILSVGVASGVANIATWLLYAALPVIQITNGTPLWSTEYDASRQATTYPGPGRPLAQLKAGDQLRVLWTAQGKDYRAYLVIGPHLHRGWVLYGQRGFAPPVAKMNTTEPNQPHSANSRHDSHWRSVAVGVAAVADAERSAEFRIHLI
jgi:hypothetical protein